MKITILFAVLLFVVASMFHTSSAGVTFNRNKRLACWGGELGCAASCRRQGRFNGGCCGQSYTRCHGTCYCNGSGYESRCYDCNL